MKITEVLLLSSSLPSLYYLLGLMYQPTFCCILFGVLSSFRAKWVQVSVEAQVKWKKKKKWCGSIFLVRSFFAFSCCLGVVGLFTCKDTWKALHIPYIVLLSLSYDLYKDFILSKNHLVLIYYKKILFVYLFDDNKLVLECPLFCFKQYHYSWHLD